MYKANNYKSVQQVRVDGIKTLLWLEIQRLSEIKKTLTGKNEASSDLPNGNRWHVVIEVAQDLGTLCTYEGRSEIIDTPLKTDRWDVFINVRFN